MINIAYLVIGVNRFSQQPELKFFAAAKPGENVISMTDGSWLVPKAFPG
jgi:hypothetical protein